MVEVRLDLGGRAGRSPRGLLAFEGMDPSLTPPEGEPVDPSTDQPLIRMQLGKLRYQPLAVGARCARGYPAVVKGFHPPGPATPGEVLSTSLDWVSCPHLESRIQALENGGWLDHLRWILDHPENEALRETLGRVGEAYTNRVRAAMDARAPGIFEQRFGSRTMGIGGTADPLALKCLHNHVAWVLAGGASPIGSFTLALLNLDLSPRGQGPVECGADCRADPAAFGLRAPRGG